MQPNFWQNLKRPFFVLAPMDDVTDSSFRRLISEIGAPDVFFTEFGNATGFQSAGRERVGEKFYIEESEKNSKLIAQIWGNVPEHFYLTARDLADRGFVGIDINMGCPEKNIVSKGCCSGLINHPELAAEIITATKEGAGSLPVSVKTRIGFKTIATDEWIGHLLQQDIAALTVHGRTQKEMSKVPAHWDEIGKARQLRDKIAPQTVIIGNGDVLSIEQGTSLAAEHMLDGVMIGRGIFHNPWVFSADQIDHSPRERIATLLRHLELFESTWGDTKNFAPLKRFFKIYVSGFPGASELRTRLMESSNIAEARAILTTVPAI